MRKGIIKIMETPKKLNDKKDLEICYQYIETLQAFSSKKNIVDMVNDVCYVFLNKKEKLKLIYLLVKNLFK